MSLTESPFDALSLIAAGYLRTAAIFGVDGWRWEWAREVNHLVFVLDAGQRGWRELARQAGLRGRTVEFLSPQAYGGRKDVNEAWIAGMLPRYVGSVGSKDACEKYEPTRRPAPKRLHADRSDTGPTLEHERQDTIRHEEAKVPDAVQCFLRSVEM